MQVKINNIIIECIQGDITNQIGIDAVVNAANAQLAPGGGVAGAIHRKAGPLLYQECKKIAPIKTGEAVITKGYNLPNPYVIHTLGPVYPVRKNSIHKDGNNRGNYKEVRRQLSSTSKFSNGVNRKEKDPASKLSLCYKNCLRVAEENNLNSIAFCAISTGIFGYPLEEAAEISIKTVLDEIKNLKSLKQIRFVLYNKKAFNIFENALEKLTKKSNP